VINTVFEKCVHGYPLMVPTQEYALKIFYLQGRPNILQNHR